MSQNLTTLLAPATIPQDGPIRQLLLLFNHVFLYAPTEDSVDHDSLLSNHGLCRQYPPVPFGKDLERFQRLLKDIGGNRAEHYSGALSSLSSRANIDIDESAVWELINRMRPESSGQGTTAETLYQARLMLQLADSAKQEEEEVNRDLAEINKKAQRLMAHLQGVDVPLPTEPLPTPPANPIHRLKAWGHLFLADQEAKKHWIITTNNEVLELLGDHAGKLLSDIPEKLISLPMPSPTFLSTYPFETYLEKRNLFRDKLTDPLKNLTTFLQDTANSKSQPNPDAARKIYDNWMANIHTITKEDTQHSLDLYRLKMPLGELFAKVTASQPPQRTENHPCTIVAVLQ